MAQDNHSHDPTDQPAVTDEVAEEMNLIVDADLPTKDKVNKKRSVGGAMLAASMLGVGEIMEPQNTEVAIEQAGDTMDPEDDILANFDFGELPPLN